MRIKDQIMSQLEQSGLPEPTSIDHDPLTVLTWEGPGAKIVLAFDPHGKPRVTVIVPGFNPCQYDEYEPWGLLGRLCSQHLTPTHPKDADLVAYLTDELDGTHDYELITTHLKSCPTCESRLAQMADNQATHILKDKEDV